MFTNPERKKGNFPISFNGRKKGFSPISGGSKRAYIKGDVSERLHNLKKGHQCPALFDENVQLGLFQIFQGCEADRMTPKKE